MIQSGPSGERPANSLWEPGSSPGQSEIHGEQSFFGFLKILLTQKTHCNK
jgi:hypothetical protein